MNIAVATSDVIGGIAALGEDAATGIDIMRLVRRGLPVTTTMAPAAVIPMGAPPSRASGDGASAVRS
jgi:hypothetical protein